MGRRFLLCPECNRFSVYVKFGGRGEDAWHCRYSSRDCTFYAFTDGNAEGDVKARRALAAANPSKSVWVSDFEQPVRVKFTVSANPNAWLLERVLQDGDTDMETYIKAFAESSVRNHLRDLGVLVEQ